VVVTVSIAVPLPVTELGVKTHALFEGKPEQAKVVAALKPLEPATVSVVIADCPGLVTVSVEGDAEIAKSGPGVTFSSRNMLDAA
jgi:hypothetical protein